MVVLEATSIIGDPFPEAELFFQSVALAPELDWTQEDAKATDVVPCDQQIAQGCFFPAGLFQPADAHLDELDRIHYSARLTAMEESNLRKAETSFPIYRCIVDRASKDTRVATVWRSANTTHLTLKRWDKAQGEGGTITARTSHVLTGEEWQEVLSRAENPRLWETPSRRLDKNAQPPSENVFVFEAASKGSYNAKVTSSSQGAETNPDLIALCEFLMNH
jgi:hypothetical protein